MSEAHDYTSRQLKKLERELRREYREAELTMRNKLKAFMQKFEKQNAVQLKALAENKITADSYKRWLNNQLSREKWFSGMVDMYTAEQLHVNQRAAEMINNALPAVYAEAHNVGTYQVEKGLSINTKYSLYNREAVGRLWKDKPQLLPKAKVNIPKDRMWNERQIRSAFTQGILQGESIPKLQKRLQGAGMITYKIEDIKDRHLKTTEQISRELARKNNMAATRNARTMMTGAQNAGKLDSYRRAVAMGAKMLKMWSATMDDRTRDSHAFLDGVTVKLEEEFPNGLMYPADPSGSAEEVWNCRCELSMQLEGFERDRASLFDANEEHFGFDSYDEWKAAHGQWAKVDGKWQKVDNAKAQGAKANTIKALGNCTTPLEVQELMSKQKWFYTDGNEYDGNDLIDITKADLDGAKDIYAGFEKVFDKYPQLIGKLVPPNTGTLNSDAMANCFFGFGRGGVTCNVKYYGNYERFKRVYNKDCEYGFHPKGTHQDAVVVHELGHAIDDMLTNLYHLNSGKHKSVSSELRSKVAKRTGVKVRDYREEVSEYAAKDAYEWFAECFAEYMMSPNPRKVARSFGEMLDEIMKGIE